MPETKIEIISALRQGTGTRKRWTYEIEMANDSMRGVKKIFKRSLALAEQQIAQQEMSPIEVSITYIKYDGFRYWTVSKSYRKYFIYKLRLVGVLGALPEDVQS